MWILRNIHWKFARIAMDSPENTAKIRENPRGFFWGSAAFGRDTLCVLRTRPPFILVAMGVSGPADGVKPYLTLGFDRVFRVRLVP